MIGQCPLFRRKRAHSLMSAMCYQQTLLVVAPTIATFHEVSTVASANFSWSNPLEWSALRLPPVLNLGLLRLFQRRTRPPSNGRIFADHGFCLSWRSLEGRRV